MKKKPYENSYFDGDISIGGYFVESPFKSCLICVLLLDTSSSMEGARIKQLNKAVNDLLVKTSLDETMLERVDIAAIEFNSSAGTVQEFRPLSMAKPVNLIAGGCSSMGTGIMAALDLMHDRCRKYDYLGVSRYKPWVVMITDGMPTDDISAASERIHYEEARGRLRFCSFGVDGYDAGTFQSLGEHCASLSNTDFSDIFSWLPETVAMNK